MRERVEAIIQHPCGDWLEFADPARVVIAESPHAVRSALDEVERLTRDMGLHAVGFVSYEAGLAFDLATRPPNTATPLAWFGLFEPKNVRAATRPFVQGNYQLGPLRPTIDREAFERAFFVTNSIWQRATPIRSISPSKSWVNSTGTREPSLPT